MRIAFVSGNREKLPDAVVPLGLLYVMESTPARHERRLIDLCFEADPVAALRSQLSDFGPDLVALGMRNIQNNDYSGIGHNVEYYGALIGACRDATPAPVVLGGSGFSVMPEALMRRLRPDYGIAGEAEATFPQLVEALEEGERAPAGIGGLHRLDGDGVHATPVGAFLDMDRIPLPDRRRVDRRYYERYGIDSIQTKRGCPLRCDYCTYPVIEGRIGRKRSPAAVADEMLAALEVQPGIRHFFVVDSVFNLPKTHAKEVCRALIERGWTLPWTCYANPLGFDAEFVSLARDAGCAGMEVGSDSGRDEVLARLRKGFTTEQIRRLHAICRDAGVPDCHTFILGTPGESLDDVRATLDFVAELQPYAAMLMVWVDDEEVLDPALRTERLRLRERVHEVLLERTPSHPSWIVPPLGVNFDPNLFRRLRRAGFHGPLWQHLRAPS